MSYRFFLVLVAVIAPLTAPALAGAQVPLDVSPTLVYSSETQVCCVAFAVTADGTAHVLMADTREDEVLYVHDASGSWSSPPEVIDTVSDVGPFNLEMDVGPDDRVQAVFDPGPGDTYGHAIRAANGSWSVEDVTNGARWLRLAVASDNVTHGAYSSGTLQYGSNAGGTWNFDPVRVSGSFTERDPTLVFEGPGIPSIGFIDRTDFSNPEVVLARDAGGTWDFETVSSVGEGPLGMVRATDGTLHAVFARNPDDSARTWVHATNATGTWQDEVVLPFVSTGVGGGSELDVALVDDQVLFADTSGSVRLILGKDGAYRSFLAELDARQVRMRVVGARLLLLVNDDVGDVYFIELPLTDDDDDDILAAFDVCPDVADSGQEDTDGNGIGDACNEGTDADGDEYADGLDNCPAVANPDQANANRVEQLAVLDVESGNSFQVETGATVSFDADAFALVATGAELACGRCATADFGQAITTFDFNQQFCDGRWFEHLGSTPFCARAPTTDLRFDFVLRSVVDPEGLGCADADFGESCAAAGDLTSALFVQDDREGDACDCDDGDGLCTGWTSTGGFCDASSPELNDDDCDYSVVGPDPDGDGVTDQSDTGGGGGGGCAMARGVTSSGPLSVLLILFMAIALRRRSLRD